MSDNKATLASVSKKIQSLKDRQERLDKDVRSLKDVLNIHDNWNAEIKNWISKRVRVRAVDGEEFAGVLKWSDRYNICVEATPGKPPRMVNKGGIIWIEPE